MGMEEWEKKLAAAGNNISKEDMNFLIMNYLVTEVSPSTQAANLV
jgi:hypothetical protein